MVERSLKLTIVGAQRLPAPGRYQKRSRAL